MKNSCICPCISIIRFNVVLFNQYRKDENAFNVHSYLLQNVFVGIANVEQNDDIVSKINRYTLLQVLCNSNDSFRVLKEFYANANASKWLNTIIGSWIKTWSGYT